MPKDATIGVRLAGETKLAAARAAAADRRSMSSLMEKLLVEYLEAEGFIESGGNTGKIDHAAPKRTGNGVSPARVLPVKTEPASR